MQLPKLCLTALLLPLSLRPAVAADTARLRRHLVALTTTPAPRNYQHLASLNQAADYVRAQL